MKNNAFTLWIPLPGYLPENTVIPREIEYRNSRRGTAQPDWEFVGNIGDASPLEYGGAFVYRDKTGVYPPEVHFWHETEEEGESYEVYRFQCESCFLNDGVLSDNQFHQDKPAWFADKLDSLADTMGTDLDEMHEAFLSSEPLKQAFAWMEVGQYHGFDNLDSYPEKYTLAEMEARYAAELANI